MKTGNAWNRVKGRLENQEEHSHKKVQEVPPLGGQDRSGFVQNWTESVPVTPDSL